MVHDLLAGQMIYHKSNGSGHFLYIRNELRKTNPTTKSAEHPGLDVLSILSLSRACSKQKYFDVSFGELLFLGFLYIN